MKPFRLSRRALLRGMGLTGIAVALPVLDAMLTDKGTLYGTAGAQTMSLPVRLMTFHWPNGTIMDRWHPIGEGANYQLSQCLQPLDGFTLPDGTVVPSLKADVNILSGLKNNVATLGVTGGGHIRSVAAFGNGTPMGWTSAGGISVDQVAANAVGMATRFPSVPVAVQPAQTENYDGGSAAMFNNLSWAGVDQPVPADRDAQTLFNRLFSMTANPTAAQTLAQRRRSVLDYVLDDWGRLSARVGQVDRARLDEHLTSIRELERQVAMAGATCTAPPEPGDTSMMPGDEFARLMMRLLVTAMRCDLTRFSSFQLYHPGNLYEWLGPDFINLERHGLSHRTDPMAVDLNTIVTQYNVLQFAYLCSLMKATPEGTGTMLDNSLIYMTSEVSEGSVHNYDDMPVILAGRGGGRVVTGRNVHYADAPTYNNLFISMLNYAGVPTTHFGYDGTAPLTQLEG